MYVCMYTYYPQCDRLESLSVSLRSSDHVFFRSVFPREQLIPGERVLFYCSIILKCRLSFRKIWGWEAERTVNDLLIEGGELPATMCTFWGVVVCFPCRECAKSDVIIVTYTRMCIYMYEGLAMIWIEWRCKGG